MPSVGPLYPSTVVDDPSIGTQAWSNPGNAAVEDGTTSATTNVASSRPSHYLKATNLSGLSVPSNAVIDGVQAEVKGDAGSTLMRDNAVRLVVGGVIQSGDRSSGTDWPTTLGWRTYGGPTDRWDRTWSASEFDANFGFAFSVTRGSISGQNFDVDAIRITVYYHVPFVDVELAGDTPSDGSAELSYVRRIDLSGETPSDDAADVSRIRGLVLDGDTPSDGAAAIQGGTVRVELSGDTPGDGETIAGKVQRIELAGDTPSVGEATPGKVQRIELAGDTPSDGEAAISRIAALELSGDTPSDGSAEIELANRTFGHRLRLDVFSPAGSLVTRIPVVFGAEYRLGQDEVGEFSLSLPAADERVAQLADGQRILVYHEGEGKVFSGIYDSGETTQDVDSGALVAATGGSRARELVWRNTLTGRQYDNQTVAAIGADLLSDTGWSLGTVATDPDALTAVYTGLSFWAALADAAKRKGWHIRENNLDGTVDIGPFGESSGLVIRNVAQARGWSDLPLNVLPLTGIKITSTQTELCNEVTMLGGGEGPYALNMGLSDRTAPYEIKSRTGGTGQPEYYIEDADSIAAHGRRQQLVISKDTIPLDNSNAGQTAAANMLYDQAVAFLQWHKDRVESYEIQCVGLRHYDHGQAVLKVGQTIRLQYRGFVGREIDGTVVNRVWRDVNTDLHVLDMTRTFAEDGSDSWKLTVSTSDQKQPTDADIQAEVVARAWAIETARRPFTMQDTFGPLRDSVDASNAFKAQVNFSNNVTRLSQGKLEILIRPVRSNAKGAASGGGSTSSGGSPHSHTINATTAMDEADPLHSHQIGVAADIVPWATPSHMQQFQFAANRNGSATYGVFVGRNGTTLPWTSIYTFSGFSHDHDINATTSSSESSHTHPISPHTHALSYGIFEGPNPSNPGMKLKINGVDVTSALGGPWNGDVTLDVTPYLVDSMGRVLRTNITIEITSNVLADLIVSLKSIITLMSIVPV